ncbi:hypothetical protein HBI06_191950 [Parastagonospora nodorum]|nr:hypothetical protein HBI06_191950 [Parastagonospora nodorum]KAH4235470.1 hypothetical protein HBI05_148660 [Parastagonospora nodorum]KAH6455676.1 hypothetical protein HBI57_130660 [Parastagonospora nodorum]KAH6470589.1 hypothetical protein HBI58_158530 [Parastagonospora nodorum]
MVRLFFSLAIGALLATSVADVFTLSLGDINQYSASLATTPTLTGSRVIFTDAAGSAGGVDAVLSEELRGNIQKAISNDCKTVDSPCINKMRDLLINPHTELESRQVVAVIAGLVALASMILPMIILDGNRELGVPIAIHVPPTQMGPAASAAEAATFAVVTGTGAPFVTVTSKPHVTSAAGPDKPRATLLSTPQDGHPEGDFAIYLSDDLAKRLTEMIDRSQQCPAAVGKPGAKEAPVKGQAGQDVIENIGAIICAAQSLVLNALSGGPFSDLTSLTGKQPAWASSGLVDAVSAVTSFAITQTKAFGVGETGATTLAIYSVYLAYLKIHEGKALGLVNWIPGVNFKGTIPQSTLPNMAPATTISASSTTTVECSASCAMVGRMRDCNTVCPTPTGDPDSRPTAYAIKTIALEPWHVPPQIPIQIPIGICPPPPNNATDFPVELFSNVYSKFCAEVGDAKESVVRAVDAKGNSPALTSRLRRWLRRASPNDNDKYKGYVFTLSRILRAGSSATCSTTCAQAFDQLSHQDSCKRGDDKKSIAQTGFLDARCASYAFSIEVPKPPEVKAKIECRSSKGHFAAPKYDGAGKPSVETAIKEWCTSNDQTYLNSDRDERYGRFDIAQLGVPKRSSFWPHVNLASSDKKAVVVKGQCISAFTDGLKECDSESDKTHGFTAVVGTAKYSLELSGLVAEGNPPWQGSDKLSFPPSEYQSRYNGAIDNGDPWGVGCDPPNRDPGHKLYPDDIDKAINYFCVDGGALKNFQNGLAWTGMIDYPPKGQTQFYDNGKGKSSHLAIGAEPLNLKDGKWPYFDKRACDGYDWKLGADDCRYAFRKILGQCNDKDDRFNAGEYKYRCVNYKMWLVNV